MLHTNNGAIHEKEIRKTFGFGKEKFSAKVRLDTKMPGVPIILFKSVFLQTVASIFNTVTELRSLYKDGLYSWVTSF